MTARLTFVSMSAIIMLSACGGNGAAENKADQLEEAAQQSDPAAAPILENAAEAVREGNEAAAQAALQEGGNAQASTLPQPQQAPPSTQAQPNRGGQQVPPPKTTVAQDQVIDNRQ